MSKLESPTEDEVKRFSSVHPEDAVVAKRVAIWQKLSDPKTVFYLPMDMVNGNVKLYLEPPRLHEPWLFGIAIAFLSNEEIINYLTLVANKSRDGDISSFHVWEGTIKNLCNNMNTAAKDKGIRVELHEVDKAGQISFVDIVWDNITT